MGFNKSNKDLYYMKVPPELIFIFLEAPDEYSLMGSNKKRTKHYIYLSVHFLSIVY